MKVEDIFTETGLDGPRGYYNFEAFVVSLLLKHVQDQKRSFEVSAFSRSRWDAFAAEGIDDIEGPTIVEIKTNIRYEVIYIYLKHLQDADRPKEWPNPRNLLFISAKEFDPRLRERVALLRKRFSLPYDLYIWGPTEINRIISANLEYVKQIAGKLLAMRIETNISRQSGSWKDERSQRVSVLKDLFGKGQISLFLGAGVSSSAGVPDWNSLIKSLFVSFLTREFGVQSAVSDSDIENIASRFKAVDTQTSLMAARYIRMGMSGKNDSKKFVSAVSDGLYKLRDSSFRVDSDLIISVASLCIPRRTGAKVKSVVTYNFDDLVERQLEKLKVPHKSVYLEYDDHDPEQLPIYHVHGFLPESTKKYQDLDKSTLVFSEEGYHKIYTDSYHWTNLVQLSCFRENNCLMVGLSMSDPNIRRLLDISARSTDKTRHFAFMKRIESDSFTQENGVTVVNNLALAEDFLLRQAHSNLKCA